MRTTSVFELATWYDTWNPLGLENLVNQKVPLTYASRYNLAFGQLSPAPGGGYTVEMTGQYAEAVKDQILAHEIGLGPSSRVLVINTEEGVRWFGIDDDGVVIASPAAFRPYDRSEGVALAPLPDGALVLATTERDGLDDFFSLSLLEDYEVAGPEARVRGSRPGGQQSFFETVATPDGVLLVTARFPLSGDYANPVSGVVVLRTPLP